MAGWQSGDDLVAPVLVSSRLRCHVAEADGQAPSCREKARDWMRKATTMGVDNRAHDSTTAAKAVKLGPVAA